MTYQFTKDKLRVDVSPTAAEMGMRAAAFVAGKLQKAIEERDAANLILGTGASQYPLHEALLRLDVAWTKVNLFHLDEYIGVSDDHPASFRRFLRERIAENIRPQSVHYLAGDCPNIDIETRRYAELLRAYPVDVACIGIGENGHIAFNDPGVADFNDPDYLKVVELDDACRRQQVGEGWFASFSDVPEKAVTLTVPAIMSCRFLCCTVPDERKSEAVYNALTHDISTSCPASVLRTHCDAVLFLDRFAANRLPEIRDKV
jgi:glucosamine-6-phosphate deaminase